MGAGGSIGGTLGSLVGDFMGSGDREAKRKIYQQMLDLYGEIPTYLQAELENPETLGASAMEQLAEDPALRAEQIRTLQGLREIADAGGLDAMAQAQLSEGLAASAGQERAQRGNILDSFARRGGGGGNQALLASLVGQQGAAQRAGGEGLRAAADAQQRQYRALMDAGALAGGVRGQDFGVNSARAMAGDERSRYNAAARNAAAQRNADRKMAAQQGTIDNRFRQAGGIGRVQDQRLGYYDEEMRRKIAAGNAVGSTVGSAADMGMSSGGGGMDFMSMFGGGG